MGNWGWIKRLLVVSSIFILAPCAIGKVQIHSLKKIDFFPKKYSYYNPGHGIMFVESKLMENLGELEIDSHNSNDIKKVRNLISTLFHRIPSGFIPSKRASKVASYLDVKIISHIISKNFKSEEDFVNFVLTYEEVIKKLNKNIDNFCNIDKQVKKLKSHNKVNKASKKDIDKLEKTKLFFKVFKKTSHHKCSKTEAIETKKPEDYDFSSSIMRNDLTQLYSTLKTKSLLTKRVFLALLWHKVKSSKDYDLYSKIVSENLNIKLINREPSTNQDKKWFRIPFWGTESKKNDQFSLDDLDPSKSALPYSYMYLSENFNRQTLLKQGYVNQDNIKYPDCGSTSLRNFLRLIFFNGISYDLNLMESMGTSEKVINFFERFNTHDSQLTQEARDTWGLLIGLFKKKLF